MKEDGRFNEKTKVYNRFLSNMESLCVAIEQKGTEADGKASESTNYLGTHLRFLLQHQRLT